MENGFRDKETLTRKDMVFGAVNMLATEDKRTLRGVDRLKYVLETAQALCEWVQNGRATNGSARSDSFECQYCPTKITGDTAYEWLSDERELQLACRPCFESYGLADREQEWDEI